MASALIFTAGMVTAAIAILGTQYLRRLWREYQADVQHARDWDAEHEEAGGG